LSLLIADTIFVCSAYCGDGTRVLVAVRTAVPPVIDGFLTDTVWQKASPAGDFIQRDPDEGRPASEDTEVRVLYDDAALYFGCMFFDSEPGEIVAQLTRRDNEDVEADLGSIRIDSYHDHQTAYEFTFNPSGVKVDILQYDDANREDPSWDPVWDLQTRVLENGWAAELRIPFSILRFKEGLGEAGEGEWGINVIRHVSRKQEDSYWVYTPKSESGFVSRFGHLSGLANIPPPRQFEVLPFVVAKQELEPERADREAGDEFSTDAGLDLRYGLSSNFVLDATFNPDFGQVEADPAVLNLTTFETFYPEKRPFFIEGTQIIRFSTFGDAFGPGMFYSRRIGRAIDADEVEIPEGGRIVSVPQTVSILGAAKFSGKTAGGLSIGVLEAFTEEETATVSDSTGVVTDQVLEPFAHYNVIRLRQDVLQNSNIGMIVTSTAKTSRSPAITAGGDWNLRFGGNTYQVDGFIGLSRTTNSQAARVNGSAGKVRLARIAARHWLWNVGADFTSKTYNINDVGFFFRPNDFGATSTLQYKEDSPSEVYRNYSVSLFLHERRNFDARNLNRETNLSAGFLFSNYWEADLSASLDMGKYDDRETRGNGDYQRPHPYSLAFALDSDEREDLIVSIEQVIGRDTRKRRQTATRVEVRLRPTPWTEWSVEGGYERVDNLEAWVDNVSQTDGTTASIFADRSTEEFDITLRGAVTFTRDLTLQFYGQMLLANGRYEAFRRLIGTSTFEPFVYQGNPDFNDQFFNMNLVVRWEYLPGSTVFLVWSQARENTNEMVDATFGENVETTFSAPAGNVFLLKVSYWFNL
jgi:hypothetical protein